MKFGTIFSIDNYRLWTLSLTTRNLIFMCFNFVDFLLLLEIYMLIYCHKITLVYFYIKKNSTSTMSIPVTKLRNCLKTCYLCIQQNQSQYIQCSEADLTSDMRECSLLFSLNIAWLISLLSDALIMDCSNTCPTSRTLYLDAYKLVHTLDSQLSMHKESSTSHFLQSHS